MSKQINKGKICSEELCEKPAHCKGLCRYHYDRRYYLANEEEVKQLTKTWREEHSERHKTNQKNWRATKKGKESAHRNNRTIGNRFRYMSLSASKRGIDQKITIEQYKELVANNKCYYCPNKLPEAGGGLDRLDHRLGYQLGNVVPCCRCCNTRKGQLETAGLCYPRTVEVLMEILESERKTNG